MLSYLFVLGIRFIWFAQPVSPVVEVEGFDGGGIETAETFPVVVIPDYLVVGERQGVVAAAVDDAVLAAFLFLHGGVFSHGVMWNTILS